MEIKKNLDYSIRVDLIPELVPLRKQLLAMRKEILKVNGNALASVTYRSYKPVLTVKYRGKVQEFDPKK